MSSTSTPAPAQRITTIVFDVGGVLETSTDAALVDETRLLSAQWLGLKSAKEYHTYVYKGDWWARCKVGEVDKLGMYREIGMSLRGACSDEEATKLYLDFEKGLGVDEGMKQLLQDLKDCGMKLGVLSNYDESLEERLELFGVAKFFDVIGNSWRLKACKPNPLSYQKVLELLKSTPEESFFTDDKQANIDAAHSVGMQAAKFLDPDQLRSVLIAKGVPLKPKD